jgi:hypothetical protein
VNLSIDGYSNYHWDLPLLMFAQMQGLMGLLRQLMEVVKKTQYHSDAIRSWLLVTDAKC